MFDFFLFLFEGDEIRRLLGHHDMYSSPIGVMRHIYRLVLLWERGSQQGMDGNLLRRLFRAFPAGGVGSG